MQMKFSGSRSKSAKLGRCARLSCARYNMNMWRKLLQRLKYKQKKIERYPKNAPGPFFVENAACISCGAPEHQAPDLMTHDENEEIIYHCYFERQPITPEETRQAVTACLVSCCDAVQYGGNDPKVLRLFDEIDAEFRLEMKQKKG